MDRGYEKARADWQANDLGLRDNNNRLIDSFSV